MSFLFDSNKSKVDFDAAITPKLNALKDTFQGYVNSIYNKFVSQGTTPTAKTPAAISAAVDTLATNKYNQGKAHATDIVKITNDTGRQISVGIKQQGQVYFSTETIENKATLTLNVEVGTQLINIYS